MNLFWKKLFGRITPTTKLERYQADLKKAMDRYAEVERSVELAEYRKLFHTVKSAAFQENKKILKHRKYKDTEEYRSSRKCQKLQNSPGIRLYYQVLGSDILKQYLNFKTTTDYELLGDKKKVMASETLLKFKKFEHSKAYKTYIRFYNSYIIKEFELLKIKVASPEFKKANDFWSNQSRWHNTPEFAQQERFYELAKNPDIVFFENEKPERFEKFRSLKMTFQDEFEWNTLDKSHWDFGFHYKSEKLIGNHSFSNEKQAYHSGKNVSVVDGILKLNTKHEKTIARAWDASKGFIEKEFNYTSDVLQTAAAFRQRCGVFSAKLRCKGDIQHAFWLGAESKLPYIKIFHFNGKSISLGNANKNLFDGIKIKGINASQFYIYTLIWSDKELIWMINDYEVYRTVSNIPSDSMYLAFNSFISQNQKGSAGNMEVDWVRTYTTA